MLCFPYFVRDYVKRFIYQSETRCAHSTSWRGSAVVTGDFERTGPRSEMLTLRD